MRIKHSLQALFGLFLAIFLLVSKAEAASSNWQEALERDSGAKVRVLSSFYQNDKQQKSLILGLQFDIQKGWHVYGNDSSGIGMPPSVSFKGSSNYKNHQILWPKAIAKQEQIGKETIRYSVYEDDVILPIEVVLKNNEKPTKLKITLNYGLCKDVCIPASSDFIIDIKDEEDEKSLKSIQKYLDKRIILASVVKDAVVESKSNPSNSSSGLFYALFAAFLGGLILNVMPCVLPVLGIKLMSVINHQNSKTSHIRLAFFSTIIGIISCFAVFAFFAIIIKFTGNIFNWGLQFQNPYFLIFLIAVILVFIANMMGLFEITFDQFASNFINKKISKSADKNIFIPNFLSGILAVLLATPCSAPFLGSAISFSITQNSPIIFLIFMVMGLGLALPYFILIISPKLVYLLPKPGNWMLRLKNLMALLLILTILWLIYVLANNIAIEAGIIAFIVSILFFYCFKIKIKSLKIFAFIALAIALIALPQSFKKVRKPMNTADMMWIRFNEDQLYKHVAAGQTVVVDVTADWCITCKFNKLHVLHDKEVVARLRRDDNIVAMRADITKPNMAALDFIHKKGRYAIPFNAVYGPNAPDGLLTNELLNKEELFALIDEASITK